MKSYNHLCHYREFQLHGVLREVFTCLIPNTERTICLQMSRCLSSCIWSRSPCSLVITCNDMLRGLHSCSISACTLTTCLHGSALFSHLAIQLHTHTHNVAHTYLRWLLNSCSLSSLSRCFRQLYTTFTISTLSSRCCRVSFGLLRRPS